MKEKRLEIYVTFKCNNNCVFCVEKENREEYGHIDLFKGKKEIEETFTKYKKQGYNHVNLLGGEPFIINNLEEILRSAKTNNFTVALATNGFFLANDYKAKKLLPLIDDLVVSIHGHNEKLVYLQSGNRNLYKNLALALINIDKYFKGRLLKANCVINKYNYKYLSELLKFIAKFKFQEINFSSMELRKANLSYAVQFSKLAPLTKGLVESAKKYNIILRFSEFPLCVLGDNYFLANDFYFNDRDKFMIDNKTAEIFSRSKVRLKECTSCDKSEICPGVDSEFFSLFEGKL